MQVKSGLSATASSGAMILVFGLFLFSIQDVIIKLFSDQYSVLQIVFIRGVVALSVITLLIKLLWRDIAFLSNKPLASFARGFAGFCSYTSFYLAIAAMPLAEVVAILFTMPLFVTAMSTLVLGEKVGFRRWSAVLIGFIGILIIVSPKGELNALAVLLAFIAAISYAIQTIITRYLSPYDQPLTMAFNSMLVFTGASGLLSLLLLGGMAQLPSEHVSLAFLSRDWIMPENADLGLMIFLGFNAAAGFYCLSKAYCLSEASAIAPYEYTYIIWAIVFGFVFWNEVPAATTMLGVIILVSSSFYIWSRERQLQKPAISTEAEPVPENI